MDSLNATTFYKMISYASVCLERESEAINGLNVFPVPDGDTGSNMSMTLNGARGISSDRLTTIGDAGQAVADGMLRSARGNSGVILSVFFRGLAKSFDGLSTVDADCIRSAFSAATESAYSAVMKPTEGTILSVMRAVAENPFDGDELCGLFSHASAVAKVALDKTPEQLPMLREANVVDAGGCGFLTILTAMDAVASGREGEVVADFSRTPAAQVLSAAAASSAEIVFPYCTECIIQKNAEYAGEGKAEALHRFVLSAGDSAVFVDDTSLVKIHVHTSDPGSVLTRAIEFGSLLTVKVENMREQHTELSLQTAENAAPEFDGDYGFVAVANGDGIASALRDLGTDRIVLGGQTMNPSTDDMLDAVDRVNRRTVFILPNNSNIIMVSEQAAEIAAKSGKNVIVVPTKSIPQGISALYAFDEAASPEENASAMTAAAESVITLAVTNAVRDADINDVKIGKGQFLGLVDNRVKQVSDTVGGCINALAGELRGRNCVTVFYGSDSSEAEAEAAVAAISEIIGDGADVAIVNGGQPVYRFIIAGETV